MIMAEWRATAEYQKIAEANRQFYARSANLYETTENCVQDKRLQAGLEADLDRLLPLLGATTKSLRALDACGGSGNVSLKLLRRGIDVTQTDISAELQNIFRQKCEKEGFSPRIICSEIGNFLADERNTFDLIIFSSALHHLEDIDAVLKLAFERLAPGGLLYSIYDPTPQRQLRTLTRLALRLEYFTFKVFFQTADFPKAVGRRIRRMLSHATPDKKLASAINDDTIGMLAEYHIGNGIDDLALVARMRSGGYEVVWHERYAETRFKLTRQIVRSMGDHTTFKLLLRKPAPPASGSTAS
jgi:2-polyprenyl-3-methyl-5-hydroxy-6-metoxy-1,4-benzoquinol methylase